MTSRSSRRFAALALMIVACAPLACGLGGCRGERSSKRPRQILPDLDHQPKYQAQQKSHYFHGFTEGEHGEEQSFGRTQRLPVTGTVAFGKKPFDRSFDGVDFARRAGFLQDDVGVYEGVRHVRDAQGRIAYDDQGAPQSEYLEWMPIEQILGVRAGDDEFDAVFGDFVALGRENFNIYCIVCHGATGRGDGMVGRRWVSQLPTWHDPQYQRGGEKGQDGYIFHTLLYGLPNEGDPPPYPFKMRGYMSKVSRHEAWAIVAYIRSLQAARRGTIEDAPSGDQQRLLNTRAQTIEAEQAAAGAPAEEEGAP